MRGRQIGVLEQADGEEAGPGQLAVFGQLGNGLVLRRLWSVKARPNCRKSSWHKATRAP